MKKKLLNAIIIFGSILFFTGCVEHRYYQQNHRHSDEYYHRHHRERPIEIDIHH